MKLFIHSQTSLKWRPGVRNAKLGNKLDDDGVQIDMLSIQHFMDTE